MVIRKPRRSSLLLMAWLNSRASDSNQAAKNNSSRQSAICTSLHSFGQSNREQTRNFLKELELDLYGKIGFFKLCQGTKYCFSVHIIVSSTNSGPGRAAKGANEGVNSVSYFQGCHFRGGSLPRAVHFNSLSSEEGARDRGVQPSDQLESTLQIPSQGEVQNGGDPHCLLSSPQWRLHDETQSKGRLLCCPNSPRIKKYLQFQYKGMTFKFCCLPFGLSLAPRVFTRLLLPIKVKLRAERIKTVIYLDKIFSSFTIRAD